MRIPLIAALLFVGWPEDPEKTRRWTFNEESVGATPTYIAVETGAWVIKGMSEGRKALIQTAASPEGSVNVAFLKEIKAKDLDLSVHIHALEGKRDLGGGLIWRARDAENYYLARYSRFEENFQVFKVVDGVRTRLETFDIVHRRQQCTLQVTMKGRHIVGKLDGEVYLEVDDETFPDTGSIGFWTRSDAVTAFDDLVLKEL